ncbi:hypothetical protein Csa_020764 [Cucumis sativus]|uniref:RING-type E3 ubiquitin transferase n=1 Tax=Cucumis sativus TaxID=3659 RepID=A0A0A0KAY2_CUCSA|nr:hypothetical protein Csa_020764 [Cucumis sativus]
MKPQFCHRKLLLEASDYMNLPSPDRPLEVETTTQNSSSSHSFKFSQLFPPFNLKTAFILLILLLLFFLFTIFSIYIRRFAERRYPFPPPPLLRPPHTASSSSANGVDRAVVRSLPVFAYRCDDKLQVDCPICLSEFEAEEKVAVLTRVLPRLPVDGIERDGVRRKMGGGGDTWLKEDKLCWERFLGKKR